MSDIYNFIDSNDIREYNRQLGTRFTPIEQAVLIYHSDCKIVEEKLSVLKELLEKYNEEDFSKINLSDKAEKTNIEIMLGHTYRQAVETTVCRFEKALLLKNPTENVVYETIIYAAHDSRECEENHFSTYDMAYEYICTCKSRSFLDYCENHGVKMKANIRVIALDDSDDRITEFIFDSDFRLTNIYIYGDENVGLDAVFIYVPLPFKKGDIVRTISDKKDYAIVHETPDKEYFVHARDSSAMHITALCISEYDGKLREDFGHFYTLGLERCSEEDLPEDNYYFNRQMFLGLRDKL